MPPWLEDRRGPTIPDMIRWWRQEIAGVMAVLGAIGLLWHSWMFGYVFGYKEQIALAGCGTYQDVFVEVAEHPGETWCVMKTGGPIRARGVSHGGPRTVSAVVKQGDFSNTFRDDELYAPSPDDYVYFTVSTAVVLTGLGLLGWLGLARFKAVRRARRDTAPDRL